MIKKQVLKYLEIEKGKMISGGKLSRDLNVSRTAIWKAINSLKSEGYNIISIPNEGYLLDSSCNMLSENIIKSKLNTDIIGKKIEIFKMVDSTNTYAKLKAHKGNKEEIVIVANQQSNGKGRRGKSFFSPAEAGLYMSILLYPNMKLSEVNIITIIAALALIEALEDKTSIKASIKWVNDIIYNRKKLCGILTEASVEGESGFVEYVVVGIGVNIKKSEFPDELKNIAISLEEITSKIFDRNELIAEILNKFELYYKNLNSKQSIIEAYKKNLGMLGEEIEVIQGKEKYYAKALDVNEIGELIIQTKDGKIISINCGEISIHQI